MPIEDHLIETMRAAGYHVWVHTHPSIEGGDVSYRVEAQEIKTGERWVVDAPTVYEAAVALAEKIGFDLEG